MVKAAEKGDVTTPQLERVLYAMAAARQGLRRSSTSITPTPMLDTCPPELWSSGVEMQPESRGNAMQELRGILADWLQVASPEKLRELATILESRPIVMTAYHFNPTAADPGVAALGELVSCAVAHAGCLPFGSSATPSDLMAFYTPREIMAFIKALPLTEFDRWQRFYASGSDKKTVRKMLNQLLGLKAEKGRPKEMR